MTQITPIAGQSHHVVIRYGPPSSPTTFGMMVVGGLQAFQRQAYTPFAPPTREGQAGIQDFNVSRRWQLNADFSGGTAHLVEEMVESAGYGYALGKNANAAGCGTCLFTRQKGYLMPAPAHVAAGTRTDIKWFVQFDNCLFAVSSANPAIVYKFDATGVTPTDDVAGLTAAATHVYTDGAYLYVCQGTGDDIRRKIANGAGTGAWSDLTVVGGPGAVVACPRDENAVVTGGHPTGGQNWLIPGGAAPQYPSLAVGWTGTGFTNLKWWKGLIWCFKPEGIWIWVKGHLEQKFDCGDLADTNNFTKCVVQKEFLVFNVKNTLYWTLDGERFEPVTAELEDVAGFIAINSLAASAGPLYVGGKIAPLEAGVGNSGAKSVTTPAADLTNDTAVGVAAWSNPDKAGASDNDYATTLIGVQGQGPLSGGAPTDDAAAGNVAWTDPANAQTSNNNYATAAIGSGVAAGPNTPATIADDAGVGTEAWTNPTNAGASDDSRATVTLAVHAVSHWLKGTNPGFAVPSDATISGIEIKVEAQVSAGAPDGFVRMIKGGAFVGTFDSKAIGGAADTVYTYGGINSLWGTTWTPAQINAADFGVGLYLSNDSAAPGTAGVDAITITVYYNHAGPSHYLKSVGYAFAIPTGAQINGVVVEAECKTDAATTPATLYGKLVIGGAVAGSVRSIAVPVVEGYVALGSASDLWGNTLTEAQVEAATFGVVLYVNGTEGQTVSVDHIRITVYYGTPQSNYLKALNFNANVPAGVTVTGIKVEVECKSSVSDPNAGLYATLVRGGVIETGIGAEKVRSTTIPTTEAYKALGGASDLWAADWSVSEVNAATFGVVLYASGALGQTVSIDHVRITVYYMQAGGANNYIFAWDGPGRGGFNPIWSDAAGVNPMQALLATSLYDATTVRLYTCSDNANWKTRYINLSLRHTPNAFDVDATNVSYIHLTRFSANFKTIKKWLREVVLSVVNPSNTTFARIYYSIDGADFVQMVDEDGAAVTLTLNEAVVGCYAPKNTTFNFVIFKIELWSTLATSAASITAFNARGEVMVTPLEQYQFTADCGKSVNNMRGEPDLGPLVRQHIFAAARQGYPVDAQLPDGGWHQCLFRSPSPQPAISSYEALDATMALETYGPVLVVLVEVSELASDGSYQAWSPG